MSVMTPPVTRFMIYQFVMWFLTVTSFSTKWRPLVRPLLQLSQTNTARHFNMDQISSQIYCNVELNLAYTEAVGFDMDFTLCQVTYRILQTLSLTMILCYDLNELLSLKYNKNFEKLLFDSAKQKLHQKYHYGESVAQFVYQ